MKQPKRFHRGGHINRTISVSPHTAKMMHLLKREVNWSHVCEQAILKEAKRKLLEGTDI